MAEKSGADAKREVMPSKEELAAQLATLYERLRTTVNGKVEAAMQVYGDVLNDIQAAYKEVESSDGVAKLRGLILRATTTLEKGLASTYGEDYVNRLPCLI